MKVFELMAILDIVDPDAEVMVVAAAADQADTYLVCPIGTADMKYRGEDGTFHDEDPDNLMVEAVLLFSQEPPLLTEPEATHE